MLTSACSECGGVVSIDSTKDFTHHHCPRCGALLYHQTFSDNFIIMMALTTLLLFIPLLFLPVLNVNFLGFSTTTTLPKALWGLVNDQEYIVAIVSIITGLLVPFLMIIMILATLIAPKFGIKRAMILPIYRVYESCKEWGMAEVYLVAILVSMIKLSEKSILEVGLGLYLFALFALMFYITNTYYNPDKIWESYEK